MGWFTSNVRFSLQVLATCNVEQSFFNDWFTGHLNFQIEHQWIRETVHDKGQGLSLITAPHIVQSTRLAILRGKKMNQDSLKDAIFQLTTMIKGGRKKWRKCHNCKFSSVQFSRSVVSNSLRAHELQHARPPCQSSTPGVHSNSRPLSRWCHPTISSSAVPFSSCP